MLDRRNSNYHFGGRGVRYDMCVKKDVLDASHHAIVRVERAETEPGRGS